MPSHTRLSTGEKFNYAIGEFASNIMFSAISFYLLYFMINVGGLSPFYASVVFLVSRVWDAVTDYLMGLLCDYTMLRGESRRAYMLWGAIPFGLFFVLLWIVPNTSVQVYKLIYYLCLYCLYNTIWTVVYIPYNSLLANMSDDYDERTSLNGWRVLVANIGMISGAALFPILAEGPESIFYRIFGSESASYFFASVLFAIIGASMMLICALNVRERPCPTPSKHPNPIKTLKEFFSMAEFRNTLMHYILAMTGADIVMAIFVFYISDSLAISGSAQGIFLALPFIASTFSAMFWVKLSERYSKHRVYALSVLGIVLILATTLFIPQKGYLPLAIFCIVVGFFMSSIQVLPFASIPDVVEVDEYYHGVRREGSYFGVVQFAYNFSSGIAVSFVSLLLGAFGYLEYGTAAQLESFVQPQSALIAIRAILAFFPSVLLVCSAIFSRRANMDRERFNTMKKKIAKRREAHSHTLNKID